jgi:hypothetical protein
MVWLLTNFFIAMQNSLLSSPPELSVSIAWIFHMSGGAVPGDPIPRYRFTC